MNGIEKDTAEIIDGNRARVAEAAVALQYELQPELARKYGEGGHAKCVQDVNYHLSYLVEALSTSSPALFADYVAWARVLLAGLGIPERDLVTNLECLRNALSEVLPPAGLPIMEIYIDAGLRRLSEPQDPPPFINEENPLGEMAREYLQRLLHGERQVASALILDAVQGGANVKDIYLNVFQPSQHEIGRLWQMNRITVAQEHYCTAATQLIMSQLYPYIFNTEKSGRRLVASCVGGELHEIGIRMVADFFEMEGWDTYYLGANTPAESIIRSVEERQADVLAISATITFHVSKVAELIDKVRASASGGNVKILVGGYPFNVSAELWKKVGSDACAQDALQAVEMANSLLA